MKHTFLLLIAMGLFLVANAQDTKTPSTEKPSEELENLQLANQLAKYGYKTYSATALIEAAKIMSSVNTQELKFESYKQEPKIDNQAKKQKAEVLDLEGILVAARKYADGDADLLSAIAEIEKESQATRGRVGGPGENYSYVAGNGTDTYEINFIEGELAEIGVGGDGDTDLDLYVYDSSGNLITQDEDYTDKCYVSWVPKWTGRYNVMIVNRGPILNNYLMLTN
ncbi:hypothetical protein [Cyclobacterium salsum]|uniref:hypothetical protein n=1 Tax=Cyclobacterium salsum TaxID=2666329 RepID=UPI001390AC1A|nr:hypothetical protein [Cyclobacterium salsum]